MAGFEVTIEEIGSFCWLTMLALRQIGKVEDLIG